MNLCQTIELRNVNKVSFSDVFDVNLFLFLVTGTHKICCSGTLRKIMFLRPINVNGCYILKFCESPNSTKGEINTPFFFKRQFAILQAFLQVVIFKTTFVLDLCSRNMRMLWKIVVLKREIFFYSGIRSCQNFIKKLDLDISAFCKSSQSSNMLLYTIIGNFSKSNFKFC